MKFLGKKDKETHKLPFAKQCAPQCGAQGTQRSAKQMAPNGGKLPMGKKSRTAFTVYAAVVLCLTCFTTPALPPAIRLRWSATCPISFSV